MGGCLPVLRLIVLSLVLMTPVFATATAQESALKRLETSDDSRGWNAVGRLNLGKRAFCTGTLISTQLVLTAAHCLYDKATGARVDPAEIEFLAGWRNGRAAAYRGVKRMLAHPDDVYRGGDRMDRVAHDIALIELDQPIRSTSIVPFGVDTRPSDGDEVGVVSYALDRAEAPSLQEICHVLGREPSVLVLSCNVDFGSSGAPIFSMRDGVLRVVSVVSSKAEYDGQKVALGTDLEEPLEMLRQSLAAEGRAFQKPGKGLQSLEGGAGSTAKFLKP
jgi:V8-like Glu-specific endopeptidase